MSSAAVASGCSWQNGPSSCSLDVDVATGRLAIDEGPVGDRVPEGA